MDVVIIGNGITGITAAITIRKLSKDTQITVISSESEHFYSRTALMYLYMGHLKYPHLKPYEDWFWRENNIHLIRDTVVGIDFAARQVTLQHQPPLAYQKLLLATGSVPRKTGVPGENLAGIQGFYGLDDLQLMEANTRQIQRAVIVGGGLIGIELAEMLATRCIPTTLLVREPHYWANVLPAEEGALVARQIHKHGLELRLNTVVAAFAGDAAGRLQAVITQKGEKIPCQFAGVAIGVQPNISFLQGSALATNRGILVNEYLETNLPGVYAAGDCAELGLAPGQPGLVEQIWYTGRMQGETVAYSICGQKMPYQRGIWFNSAKFFDLEYQTYGIVPVKPGKEERTLYWEHAGREKALRINFRADTQAVTGLNVLGIRYRHEVCEAWIKQKKSITYVLEHLQSANFDPEFYRRHEGEIRNTFTAQLNLTPAYEKA
jgi:NADPH-dependent 2,4-dienoyl-CoA reductase/sulfur reductase-like enzyme